MNRKPLFPFLFFHCYFDYNFLFARFHYYICFPWLPCLNLSLGGNCINLLIGRLIRNFFCTGDWFSFDNQCHTLSFFIVSLFFFTDLPCTVGPFVVTAFFCTSTFTVAEFVSIGRRKGQWKELAFCP